MISTDLHDGPTFFVSGGPDPDHNGELRGPGPCWDAERRLRRRQELYLHDEPAAGAAAGGAAADFGELIGRSPALGAVLEQVRRVAPTDASVLIGGETGTGKELIARAIHAASRRRDKPMIKINCGAMPAALVESELFGHERGAFTGAVARHVGRFETGDGGTIFLDEVGELPPEAQVKLLRFLQERTIDRVGGTGPLRLDVRILAATNRDLRRAVAEKAFREDLYYRLSVFPIVLPPLRERKEDVPLLARALVEKFAARLSKRIDGVSRQTMRRLIDYHWPGNVRELENVLERAVILAGEGALEVAEIDPGPLPALIEAAGSCGSRAEGAAAGPPDLKTVERKHISAVLQQTGWVVEGPRGAAVVLGLHPNTLRHRMRKLGIARQSAQPGAAW